jgi:hypothetical protein
MKPRAALLSTRLLLVTRDLLATRNLLALLFLVACLPSCATAHLMRWSREKKGYYDLPTTTKEYVIPGGTLVAFPVALLWDVGTFPFQLIWSVYPYGSMLEPEEDRPPVKG